ncbi:MAG: hypothetical protein HC869_14175 [Rhodospirillales bacterium]|nr:hypothetical protein [Rhodospirillales bacterium]
MALLLIDDQGHLWDGASRTLRASFDSPYSGGEFSDYAVTNLGFIAANAYGGSCQIRLRPSFVAPEAMRSLLHWLNSGRIDRIVLSWLDKDWHHELLRSRETAVARVSELVEAAGRTQPNDFLAHDVKAGQLPENTALGILLRYWDRLSEPEGHASLMNLLNKALGNRYVLAQKDPHIAKMVFREFGGGLFNHYDAWRSNGLGVPIEDLPDHSYGRWIADAYDNAMAERAPRIADVDAIVKWPHVGRTRMRYRRVIVPYADVQGENWILGGSIIDNRIDLRLGMT